jgi:hypothetical protein
MEINEIKESLKELMKLDKPDRDMDKIDDLINQMFIKLEEERGSELPIHGPGPNCPACGNENIFGGESEDGVYVSNCNVCWYVYEIRMDYEEEE